MYIATLLTHPETPLLDRAAVESLRDAWAGGDALWLDPGVAAEFPLAEMPANRWDAWEALAVRWASTSCCKRPRVAASAS